MINDPIQYNTIQYNTAQHSTTQHNTTFPGDPLANIFGFMFISWTLSIVQSFIVIGLGLGFCEGSKFDHSHCIAMSPLTQGRL